MTAITADAPRRAPSPLPWLALILLAVAVAASAHAIAKHSEASAIMDGCARGPHSAWQVRGHADEYWLLCEAGNGEYGVAKLRCTKRGWVNQTAFVPGASQHAAGSLARAWEYLSARAQQVAGGIKQRC